MKNAPIERIRAADEQRRFVSSGLLSLLGLTLFLLFIWWLALSAGLDREEENLWRSVRAAQLELSFWRASRNCAADVNADPWQLGLIGAEWSPLTTTLGDLAAKRTACNPAWAVWLKRHFVRLGLQPGDKVAIFSSASFPGLILNSLAAVRDMGLDTFLVVSLGASTWGANHMACPWPDLEAILSQQGFIGKKAAFYTLGGGEELGHGLPRAAIDRLEKAAADQGVKILTAPDLEGMVRQKSELLKSVAPKLLISIGGSHANLGDDPAALKLPPGLIRPGGISNPGNGVISRALDQGLPVIHLLNIKKLGSRVGIPFDSEPVPKGPGKMNVLLFATGVLAYLLVLWFQRRWRIVPLP